MRASAHPNALRVAAALGPNFTVVEFDESTHTAQEAADAIGCSLAQIAKSILFRSASGRPVMVIASGVNRVDEKKIRTLLGEKIERAQPDFVKEMTGFEVGGVPPVAHASPCVIYLSTMTSRPTQRCGRRAEHRMQSSRSASRNWRRCRGQPSRM